MKKITWRKALIIWVAIAVFACLIPVSLRALNLVTQGLSGTSSANPVSTHIPFQPATGTPDSIAHPTLTPELPRILPTIWVNAEEYIVQPNDTLAEIALRYGVDMGSIMQANSLTDPNTLYLGQVLLIPPPSPQPPGSDFKIIPDSELVYGPYNAIFDLADFIQQQNGYLSTYREEVDGVISTGVEITARVSSEYSVNARLLLAVLEYQSSWVTERHPPEWSLLYPMGHIDQWREGLYRQLAWAANNLNYGYYAWRVNSISRWVLPDGSTVPVSPTINAGTSGVQHLMSQLHNRADWDIAVMDQGIYQTYSELFGYPFDNAIEPLLPPDLVQPPMQLPFESGQSWSFTGGPHSAWGDGSAWAALDFAPPGVPLGCILSDAWVVAAADGWITYTGYGVVLQDLDQDQMEQTGWSILYLHIDSYERVEPGTFIYAGERLGHPSCEGGLSNGTHVHIARRYNGEWIPADGPLPFHMDGWVSQGTGKLYDGYLNRDGQSVEAWDDFVPENQIHR